MQRCVKDVWCNLLSILACLCLLKLCYADQYDSFHLRSHLGTKTRYDDSIRFLHTPSIHEVPDPLGYEPTFLYLISRHGTRWPSGTILKEMFGLENILKDSKKCNASYAWISQLIRSNIHRHVVGDLHPYGGDEMWKLGSRLQERFTSLARLPYTSEQFPIVSTQVARTSESASSFAAAFFPPRRVEVEEGAAETRNNWRGGLRKAEESRSENSRNDVRKLLHRREIMRPESVALTMVPKKSDPTLRFFDMCPRYSQSLQDIDSWLDEWIKNQTVTLIPAISRQLEPVVRNLTYADVSALWNLCALESNLGKWPSRSGSSVCDLFDSDAVRRLEWIEDVRLYERQSHGDPLNVRIAAPLVQDLQDALRVHSEMGVGREAVEGERRNGEEENGQESAAQGRGRDAMVRKLAGEVAHAKFQFAHCETVVPFASLLGIIPDFKSKGPPPPHGWTPPFEVGDVDRIFRGGRFAPYGANILVILYRSLSSPSSPSPSPPSASLAPTAARHRVRLLYNEQVIPAPGSRLFGFQGQLEWGILDPVHHEETDSNLAQDLDPKSKPRLKTKYRPLGRRGNPKADGDGDGDGVGEGRISKHARHYKSNHNSNSENLKYGSRIGGESFDYKMSQIKRASSKGLESPSNDVDNFQLDDLDASLEDFLAAIEGPASYSLEDLCTTKKE